MQKGLLLNKKGTKLIWAVPAKNKITVPDSVTSIADNALKAGKATSVYLGKKVKMTFYAEANNLLNQPLRYYQGTKDRTMQAEYYGVRMNAGLKISF